MKIEITGYKNKVITRNSIVDVDDNLKERVHYIFRHNIFVFIEKALYSEVDYDSGGAIACMGDGNGYSVDEILAMDVMFILASKIDDEVGDIVQLIESYVGGAIEYAIARRAE